MSHDPIAVRKTLACVLAHNSNEQLFAVLASIKAQTHQPNAVLVIDNGSVPAVELSEWAEYCEIIRLPENRGVGVGHNSGLKWAQQNGYPWVWILEHDDVADPLCLEVLVRHAETLIESGDDWAIIYPKNFRDSAELGKIGTDDEPADETFAIAPDMNLAGEPPSLTRAVGFTFNGPLVQVKKILALGGLREDLFVGHEDWDLAQRLTKTNQGIYYARDAHLVHTNKAAKHPRAVSTFRLYYSARNQTRLALEAGAAPHLQLLRGIASSFKWLARGMPEHAVVRVRATLDAFRGRMGKVD